MEILIVRIKERYWIYNVFGKCCLVNGHKLPLLSYCKLFFSMFKERGILANAFSSQLKNDSSKAENIPGVS